MRIRPIFFPLFGMVIGAALTPGTVPCYAQDAKGPLASDRSEKAAERKQVLLATGEDRTLDLDFDPHSDPARAAIIGNPQIVTTTLMKMGDKRQIQLKPLKAGETTVTLRDEEGTIRAVFEVRVTGTNLLRVAQEVRELLRDIEGIEIRIVGPKVVLEGEVLVPADYGRLLTVLMDGGYAANVLNLTTLSTLALQVIAKRIQDDVNTFAQNVKTRVVNGVIFLEGTVDNVDQAKRAEKIAVLYLPDPRPGDPLLAKDQGAQSLAQQRSLVMNFIVVNPPPQKKQEKLVRVTVHFVELSKDYNKVFGFKWQPGFTSDPQISVGTAQTGAAGSAGSSFSGTISSLIPKLQSAQQAGYARILKSATTVVRSGQPAKLVEQTEFPFAYQGAGGQVAAGKTPVGLSVAVTPQILGQSEDIQMDLILSQSNLVGRAPAAGGAPVTAVHNVETKIYVKSNESAAVAGVTSSDIGTDFNKDDPKAGGFEGKTDPLFNLLRTKAYRKKKSQFVIFVTPQIIENASQGTEDLKKNFRVKVN